MLTFSALRRLGLELDEVLAALSLENAVPVAQGGQKVVLKGMLSGAEAAAKVVFLEGGPNDALTLERARREVELLAAVDSPYVVRLLTDAIEVGDPTHAVAWVEEWLDGSDLASHLGNKLAEEEVWNLLRDMAEALDACHTLDVVHRDLSPRNVRRSADGHYVLMDPGLAKHLERTALTGAFQPGTLGWRSPEHVFGGEPAPSSDIFCLGILAFYALTATYPISPSHSQEDYDRTLVDEQAPRVESIATGVSAELANVVNRCLQRQPARRYLDGGELRDDLYAIGRIG